jgi:hypothetical protein
MLIEGIRAKDYGEKTINCITCDTKVTAELQNVFDTRFGIEKAWDICRCMVCGTKQTIPIPLSDELKRLYETYFNFGGEKETIYTRFRRLFFSSKLYRFWLAIDGDISLHSQKGTCRLLDVGCRSVNLDSHLLFSAPLAWKQDGSRGLFGCRGPESS